MKFLKLILAVAMLAVSFEARAQFDFFAAPRTIVLPLKLITATTSNQYIDTHGFQGTAKIDIFGYTNSGNSGLTCQILGSQDQTNYAPISYALATQSAVITSNTQYSSTALLATNNYNYAGVVTTPTASSAGFATKYIAVPSYTSTAAITVTTNVTTIGFQVADAPRYLQFVWTVTGGSSPTNTVGAVFTGRKTEE